MVIGKEWRQVKRVLRPLLVRILVLLTCLSGCSSQEGYAGSGAVSPEETTGTKKPLRIYTAPVYTGQASGELNEIGNTINDYVSAHPDTFSGGYFSADSSKILVGVAEPGDKAAADLEKLADRLDPGRRQVLTTDARWSWSELDALKDTLAEEFLKESKGGIDSVGLDTSRDAVVVTVLMEPGDPRLEDNPRVLEVAERYGDMVMFRKSLGPVSLNGN
jgi:hypothetical protein